MIAYQVPASTHERTTETTPRRGGSCGEIVRRKFAGFDRRFAHRAKL